MMFHTRHKYAGIALATLFGTVASTAYAQTATVVGSQNPPEVQVNLNVLNSLQPASNSKQGLNGTTQSQPASSGSVLLIPPPSSGTTSQAQTGTGTTSQMQGSSTVSSQASGNSGSVLLLTPPATPSSSSSSSSTSSGSNDFVFPALPKTKPQPTPTATTASPSSSTATSASSSGTKTTTQQTTSSNGGSSDAFSQLDDMLSTTVPPENVQVPQPNMSINNGSSAATSTSSTTASAGASSSQSAGATSSNQVTISSDRLRLLFKVGKDQLTDQDKTALTNLASRLNQNKDQRIQLRAYASSNDGTASAARRLALSRALQVRAYLIEKNVRSTRIDVRALGDKVEDGGPLDRVDILLVKS